MHYVTDFVYKCEIAIKIAGSPFSESIIIKKLSESMIEFAWYMFQSILENKINKTYVLSLFIF